MKALIVCASTNYYNCNNLDISSYDFIISCDGGIDYLNKINITPDLVLGDFDSCNNKDAINDAKEVLTYPVEKDYSDLELAIIEAKKRGYDNLDVINATGGRLDHFIANCNFLVKYSSLNITILDNNNKLYLTESNTFQKSNYQNISFFAVSSDTVITLKGFKYNLENYTLNLFDSLCLSNSIKDDKAQLITNKKLLVVLSN